MNSAYCNSCKKLVPSSRVEREGKVFLLKDCPTCGPNENLISNDAVRARQKRDLDVDVEHHYEGCDLDCTMCGRHNNPKFTFLSVTNRCNLNCPICFDNVPGLGFEFEPPLEYFDSIFKQVAQLPRPPIVCLFGGEPTSRDDLFDIIALSRSYGLRTRVFTNGLRMADEGYCRDLLRTGVEIQFSYDGGTPDTYRKLRGNAKAMELKQKALDNIAKHREDLRRKMTLIVVLAKDLNESELPDILKLVHERRDIIGSVFLMPLVHTWDNAKWDYDPPRMTTEDVEGLIEKAFPGYHLEFLPLGVVHELSVVFKSVGRDANPYAGAHPNCESLYHLVSDGQRWLPIAHFLKTSELKAGHALLQLGKRQKEREQRWKNSFAGRVLGGLRLRNAALRSVGFLELTSLLLRHIRVWRLFKGAGIGKLYHLVMLLLEMTIGLKALPVRRRHMNMQEDIRLVVLPLEDNRVLETERLERCPTAHVYLDPRTGKITFVPLCAWKLHNRKVLRNIADYYAQNAVHTS